MHAGAQPLTRLLPPPLHSFTLQALQRNLPRPVSLTGLPPRRPASELPKLSLREKAEELVAREMASLLQHDAAKYPVVPVSSALGGKEAKEARKVSGMAREVQEGFPPGCRL